MTLPLTKSAAPAQGVVRTGSGNGVGRFPKHGTPDFSKQCNWTAPDVNGPDCTFIVRPSQKDGEGITKWISAIASAYILARQAGCKLQFDYGPHVDIRQVLTPLGSTKVSNSATSEYWEHCSKNCFRLAGGVGDRSLARFGDRLGRKPFARPPNYREGHRTLLYRSSYQDLEVALPGFQLETGMACSLGNVFHLSPSASLFEPRLFSKILPSLHEDDAIVMTLYIRTGQTDRVVTKKRVGEVADERPDLYRNIAKATLDCALSLEEQYLSGSLPEPNGLKISQITWMLITDSQYMKQWVTESFNGNDTNARVPAERQKWPSQEIRRVVVSTGSRGAHTMSRASPSTADFADAMIDWYLIGESDLVIADNPGYSYGSTAALRTARPFYDGKKCAKSVLVREGMPPDNH
eukprot:CAMPEP_0178483246 /NCGR_PEP_ID=MMETSP0696-20121128/7136_1 /TAXON_ID=265572 /ORGANISM="Extubocellulus spinifer, Strain CCMP396" /LENGTH=406 /DNA_ID=CAMNT_0020110759 /DNA_START=205 /DNA_END=1425 /DNA_ORIENTATION=-